MIFILLTACAAQPAAQATEPPILPTVTFTVEPTLTLTSSPAPTMTLTPAPTLPPGVTNVVHVDFFNSYSYYSEYQTFTNREVQGFLHAAIGLQNTPDDSSAPVYGLGLEFSTEPGVKRWTNIQRDHLKLMGPPVFKWFFGDVPEADLLTSNPESYFDPAADIGIPFTPGFDAAIRVDETHFSETGDQVVTITIVPRQYIENLQFGFHLIGGAHGDKADVVVTSLDPGEHRGPAGESIYVSLDRKDIGIGGDLPLPINEPYSFTMTLRVNPHGSECNYLPYFYVAWIHGESDRGESGRGATLGNMLVVPVENVGIWTWIANGEYLWEWQGPGIQYSVSFN